MQVLNVHSRKFKCSSDEMGSLLESLASSEDKIWPNEQWPRMTLDKGLAKNSSGGHGPIGYFIEEYIPQQLIRFTFTQPQGFLGEHRLEVFPAGPRETTLEHVIDINVQGRAKWHWLLLVRPLHDALIEDAFNKVDSVLSTDRPKSRRSVWVKFLRFVLKKIRNEKQK